MALQSTADAAGALFGGWEAGQSRIGQGRAGPGRSGKEGGGPVVGSPARTTTDVLAKAREFSKRDEIVGFILL